MASAEPARRWERAFANARLATMSERADAPYGLIEDGVVAIAEGRIAWVGAAADLPAPIERLASGVEDCGGRLMTPALVDCHTHLVWAGDRAGEFEMRLNGASYAEIAKAGGGIRATVAAVRAASEDDLIAQSLPRLRALMAGGVATVEVKSGYGLDAENEAKMLRAARALARETGVSLRTSFLGAHALAPEFEGRANDYIDDVCLEQLPRAHGEGLVDAVDGFCETIAFSAPQIERVFQAALALDLPIKLHAEQLSNQRGAELAASYGALSADHLEWLDADGVAAMAKAGTVAVLLPGAFYTLGETRLPPIDALREAGVGIAVATDLNPGSSPIADPLAILNMACVLFGLTPEEALAGMTREGARALGLGDETGTLEMGKRADLAIWSADQPAHLAYGVGLARLERLIIAGAAL